MIKNKIKFILVLLILCISTVNAQTCYLGSNNNQCLRIDSALNSFELDDLSSKDNFDRYEVRIFNSKNPANELKFNLEDFTIEQITPFLEPAVYNIEVKAYDLAQNSAIKTFEYIFDNTNPLPPIVPLKLETDSYSIKIPGRGQLKTTVFALDSQGKELDKKAVNSDGTFELELSSLKAGINYVKFYLQKDNGIRSDIVERVIQSGEVSPQGNAVSSVKIDTNLESLNERTKKMGENSYVTTKRNFYIQGTTSPQTVVYVNGVRALSDQAGKYGAFVLLNQGENEIVTLASNKFSKPVKVSYDDLRFQFQDIDYEKIVKEDKLYINIKTNFKAPIYKFLNGEYISTIDSDSTSFNVDFTNLKPGKNFVEIRGLNKQKFSEIIYYDTQEPNANIISSTDIGKPNKLAFEISDDIGININSVNLKIGPNNYQKEDLKVRNDFFLFDISNLVDGDYNYELSGEDLVGKSFSISGSINVNQYNTLINDIFLDNGELIGNKIFLKEGKNYLNIIPSRNIAFKSLKLDDVEQSDYEIFKSDVVKLGIEPKNDKGTLNLIFINSNYDTFNRDYEYFVLSDEKQIELDYVSQSASENKVKISGEINGEYIDWDSISFNKQKNLFKYGNYFESLIELDKDKGQNLNILGNDYAKNSFSQSYGNLLFKDITTTEVVVDEDKTVFDKELSGSLLTADEPHSNYNFIESYDGFKMAKSYISSDRFELPLHQREGLRAINLKGFESSKKKVLSNNVYNVEYSDITYEYNTDINSDYFYFSGNDLITSNSKGFVQGNIVSNNEISSVTINGKNCPDKNSISFVCFVDLSVGDNTFEVNVDGVKKSITIHRVSSNVDVTLDSVSGDFIHNSGDKIYLFGTEFDIKGNLENKDAVVKALIGSKEIYLGDLDADKPFKITSDIEDEINAIDSKEFNVQLVAEDEFGNKAFSENKITILYKRIIETLADVFVG